MPTPQVDFLPFANGSGANVVSQASYSALTTILSNGFSAGTAQSAQLNKVWRQSSIMSAVLANLIADITGQNVIDDGTTTTILSNLMASLLKAPYAVDAGAANAYSITLSPAPLAYYAGMVVRFTTVNANTGASTLNINGLGVVALTLPGGTALSSGMIPSNTMIEAVYSSTGPRFEVMAGGNIHSGVGVNQNWSNVTTSRALSTVYTNSTGKPIQVAVNCSTSSASPAGLSVTVNGLAMTMAVGVTNSSQGSAQFIVPNGQTYEIAIASGTLAGWYELS